MNLGEVKVVYDAADFRALYRACGNCKRNALIGLVAVPALFTLLAIGNGMRGIDLLFEAIPYVLIMITVYTAAYFLLPLNAVRLRKRSVERVHRQIHNDLLDLATIGPYMPQIRI